MDFENIGIDLPIEDITTTVEEPASPIYPSPGDFKNNWENAENDDNSEVKNDADNGDGNEPHLSEESELIVNILKARGYNPDAIKVEEEDGTVVEKKFFELSKEDQLSILSNSDLDPDFVPDSDSDSEDELDTNALTPDEASLISALRANRTSFEELLKSSVDAALKNVNLANTAPSEQNISELDDDTVYVTHLQNQFPDMTDEELATELTAIKSNSDIFSKKVAALRTMYGKIELDKRIEAQEAQSREVKDIYNGLLQKTTHVGYAVLDDQDREQIFNCLTNKVVTTDKTAFDMALENPDIRIKMAWFLEKGPDFFNQIRDLIQDVKTERDTIKSNTKKEVEDKEIIRNGFVQSLRNKYPAAASKNNNAQPPSVNSRLNNDNGGDTPYDFIK